MHLSPGRPCCGHDDAAILTFGPTHTTLLANPKERKVMSEHEQRHLFEEIPGLQQNAPLIERYLSSRGATGTALTLRKRLEAFVKWLEENQEEGNGPGLQLPVDASVIVCYAKALNERGMALSTIRTYVSAVGTVHNAAGLYNPTTDTRVKDLMAELREKHRSDELRHARILSRAEIRRIFNNLHRRRRGRGGRMEKPDTAWGRAFVDRALLITMIQAGMRRNEAAILRWNEVREHRDGYGQVLLRTNWATYRETWTTITLDCFRLLMEMRGTDADDSSRVFNLSASQITRRLKRMCEEAGIDATEVSGHTPRATLLRLMVENGTPLSIVQRQLRLTPPPSTQKYIERMSGDAPLVWLDEALRSADAFQFH